MSVAGVFCLLLRNLALSQQNLHTSEVKQEVAVNNDDDEIKENQDDHDEDDMRNNEEGKILPVIMVLPLNFFSFR